MNSYYMQRPVYSIVTDNQDPDNQGRVKVLIEDMDNSVETDWIPVLNFYGISGSSAHNLPKVGDQVIVAFIDDDPDNGIVLGSVWCNNQVPPETGKDEGSDLNMDEGNDLRFIKSKSGHKLIIDDKDGEERIQIISSDGATRYEFLLGEEKINIETDVDLILNTVGSLGIETEDGKFIFEKGLKIEVDELSVNTRCKDKKSNAVKNIVFNNDSVTKH